jgi:uncharacterized protein YukE
LVAAAKALYELFCGYLQTAFWGWVEKKIAKAGEQKKLKAGAEAWKTNVTPKYQTTTDNTDLAKLAVDDKWSGSAATAYANKVPAQREAMQSVKKATEAITTQLNAWAQALQVFWSAVAKGVTTFLKVIFAAIFTAAVPVTSPAGVASVVTALAKCLAELIQAYNQLDSAKSSAANALKTARTTVVQKWPTFTTASYSYSW